MDNYQKMINNLDKLDLIQIKNNIDVYIDLINNNKKDVVESLYELSNLEINFKQERAMGACVKVAGFPFLKTLEDFDFAFQPTINKEVMLDFRNFRWIDKKENIIFIGSPGVGKTHLATGIGIACAKNRYSTYFISCHELISQLKKAHSENRLDIRIKNYSKYKVLIIDEIGYLPIDIDAANMMFQLIAKRYERHCTIVTTNTPLSKWGDIFGNNMIANAILDRLLHHSHVISIAGRSYRTKDKFNDEEGANNVMN